MDIVDGIRQANIKWRCPGTKHNAMAGQYGVFEELSSGMLIVVQQMTL